MLKKATKNGETRIFADRASSLFVGISDNVGQKTRSTMIMRRGKAITGNYKRNAAQIV